MDTAALPIPDAPPVALDKWIADVGINPSTAWHWRKRGWLKTVNIAGRHYLTAAQRAEFIRRAEAGEFAKEPGGALVRHKARHALCGEN
ncbi:MAG: hypothetical protein ABSG50_14170 [Opitutaceae bacterium]|jgi:hypothetical protein